MKNSEHPHHVRRKKIAILGGGISSLTSALHLTEDPDWKAHYDITLYQQGWRLGGKGASGRNRKMNDRIEEHGLHLWFGFYHNAFNLIKSCYKENKRPAGAPLSVCFDEEGKAPVEGTAAFKGYNTVVLEEKLDNDKWAPWELELLISGSEPGGTKDSPKISGYILLSIKYVLKVLFIRGNHKVESFSFDEQKFKKSFNLFFAIRKIFLATLLLVLWLILMLLGLIEKIPFVDRLRLFKRFQKTILRIIDNSDIMRRLWIIVELFSTNIKGAYFDKVFTHGFDAINQEDYKEWLYRHGASKITVESAFVQAVYGIVFGGRDKYSFEAGTALRGVLRMLLTARGRAYYKMQGGMGDVIFAPIYEVLKKRGVKFKFFHKVTNLVLSEDKTHIERIVIDRQAVFKSESGIPVSTGAAHAGLLESTGGHTAEMAFEEEVAVANNGGGSGNASEYYPLFDVRGIPSWPSAPLYEQLLNGEALEQSGLNLECYYIDYKNNPELRPEEIVLQYKKDYDLIINGISIGAVPYIAKEIVHVSDEDKVKLGATEHGRKFLETHEKWRNMVDNITITPTQAFQLWMKRETASLGWKHNITLMGCYVDQFDTWCDMSHLIPRESWQQDECQSIAYFCGALTGINDVLKKATVADYGLPGKELLAAKDNARGFMVNNTRDIWPNTWDSKTNCFDWSILCEIESAKPKDPFEGQYFRANVNPPDLYVLSETNTTRYRLRTDASGFSNMYITGDWIFNGFNCGCIESAVISGMQTARAISKKEIKIIGETDRLNERTLVGKIIYKILSVINSILRALFPSRFE